MTLPYPTHSILAQAQPTRETDEALVARLGRGDEDALRTLHQRYAALVFTVGARFVDTGTAEEIVQDVFVTLWRKHDTFDPTQGSFKAWIVQIARRRALNELRRKHLRARPSDEGVADLPDDSIEPDEAQWLAHRRSVIRAAVDALPVAQRQALTLAFFDELTHEQIATVLRTPVGTTKTRIRLALRRLAPVLTAVVAATVVALVVWQREERAQRNEEALRMVTASDVVPLHLGPAPGTSAEAHGSYRARQGATVAVLTTSHLPAVTTPEAYVAWARRTGGWHRLGSVVVGSDGRSLLVVHDGASGAGLDEIRVTRESGSPTAAPRGIVVLTWPGALGP
jgi:RNA polymerase sigma-70 factor (ECF subfamily)